MADNPETPTWETGIYQLETTDDVIGGAGGISNRPNVELGNRTSRIKEALDEVGVYVVPGEHEYGGQNVDVNAVFEGTVSNGDVVWYDKGQNRYELALAESGGGSASTNTVAGIADVTNGRVITGGIVLFATTQPFSIGDLVYLSGVVAGATTSSQSSAVVGKILWLESTYVVMLDLSAKNTISDPGQIAHSELLQDQTTLHFTVGSILHSAINNDEPSIHTGLGDLIGHVSMYFGGTTPPTNYLECNGALISTTTYAALFSGYPFSLGYRFGGSGGSFRLPDFRGRAPRGYAHGSGRDPDRALRYADSGGITGDNPGSMQDDQLDSHTHPPQAGYANFMSSTGSSHGQGGDSYGTFGNTGYFGGNETRMKNFSAMFVIRYQ